MGNEYKNPIAKKGDFADPFVLRYNGTYYLYATNPDVRCFSSKNLVDWHLEGPAVEPETFGELVPFAPEVVYSNGKFYMYTSPSGFGHYVLESDSPLGPFRKITGNVGHDIDGSVFIDDDGRWYFYWAGDEGIWGCEMPSPAEFGVPVLTGAYLNGWTEGPLICKRDGIYYMTYTGNHYLSNGYRIQTAWSTNPLTGYQDDSYNPAVVHTQGEGVGLGHSSTVVGPNLVSYYLVYHNLNADATRDLDIDRILWHVEGTQILGPTRGSQPAPYLPDMSFPVLEEGHELCWDFVKGKWTEKDGVYYAQEGGFRIRTREMFPHEVTAELHISIPQGNEHCGIELGCGHELVYSLELSEKEGSLFLYKIVQNHKVLVRKAELPGLHICEVLHAVGIEGQDKRLAVTIDGRSVIDAVIEQNLTWLGYYTEELPLGIGYTALTFSSYETQKRRAVIPAGCSFMPVYGDGEAKSDKNGRILLNAGETMQYQIQADERGKYTVYITWKESESGRFVVYQKGERTGECFHDSKDCDEKEANLSDLYKTELTLEAGVNLIKIEGLSGQTWIERIEIVPSDITAASVRANDIFAGPFGKLLLEDSVRDDGEIEAKLTVDEFGQGGRCGILLRVTEPAEGGEGDDPVLGIDFFKGYSVSVDGEKLVIAKHMYDRKILAEADFAVRGMEEFVLRIQSDKCCICVFDGEGKEILRACDPQPLVRGCTGIWAENCRLHVRELVSREKMKEKCTTFGRNV